MLPPAQEPFDLSVLTFQEEKILLLAASDMFNKEIANQLNICELTVKKHRTNAYKKLGIRSMHGVRVLLRYIRTQQSL